MGIVWVASGMCVALLIVIVRACIWFQRWDPLDFLKELPDSGQYGLYRSEDALLLVDSASENYPRK